jgi:chemotaxis-related protein WspB
MLFLGFRSGSDFYVLEATQVIEVLPLVRLKQVPQAPTAVAGLMNYRGAPTPVIDLAQIMQGRNYSPLLSTRIILVSYAGRGGAAQPLGLIAEGVTESFQKKPEEFSASGVENKAAPYLGPVARDVRGLIQWVKIEKLLPAAIADLLFPGR